MKDELKFVTIIATCAGIISENFVKILNCTENNDICLMGVFFQPHTIFHISVTEIVSTRLASDRQSVFYIWHSLKGQDGNPYTKSLVITCNISIQLLKGCILATAARF